MNKLTADKAKQIIAGLKENAAYAGPSIRDEYMLQALEIALPVLEQQEPAEYQYYYHNHGTGTGEWLPVKSKQKFEEMKEKYAGDNDFSFRELFTHPSTTPQIDNDGWIEWKGGEMPVDYGTKVCVKFRDASEGTRHAGGYRWYNCEKYSDIVAYRVIENDGREG